MRQVIWQTLREFWQDVSLWPADHAARQERRQLARSIREHGVLWLTDNRYATLVSLPIQRRRKATR